MGTLERISEAWGWGLGFGDEGCGYFPQLSSYPDLYDPGALFSLLCREVRIGLQNVGCPGFRRPGPCKTGWRRQYRHRIFSKNLNFAINRQQAAA